jgi:hypothetical protein
MCHPVCALAIFPHLQPTISLSSYAADGSAGFLPVPVVVPLWDSADGPAVSSRNAASSEALMQKVLAVHCRWGVVSQQEQQALTCVPSLLGMLPGCSPFTCLWSLVCAQSCTQAVSLDICLLLKMVPNSYICMVTTVCTVGSLLLYLFWHAGWVCATACNLVVPHSPCQCCIANALLVLVSGVLQS